VASTITGSSVTYARGGNGSADGSQAAAPSANTGSGGHASCWNGSAYVGTTNGASGIVILRYPNTIDIAIGAGLTGTTNTTAVAGFKVTTITAGTGNVSWT
jgi:hypothetical protein